MNNEYVMRISRLTVDKLGVKLYDRVSAVIAELVANSYDADAKEVTIRGPMGQSLASKAGGSLSDKGFTIEVADDGVGMTPEQMQEFFLVVGAERRSDPNRGSTSLIYGRKVMGRKGVGKLAPFGICKVIEVISAGGEEVRQTNGGEKHGYLTSHILLDYEQIVEVNDDPDEPYKPLIGERDGTFSEKRGTTIILRQFNYRRVPDMETLSRQIAQRFGIESENWKILLDDNTQISSQSSTQVVGAFAVDTMPNTRITFQNHGLTSAQVIGPEGNPIPDLQAGFKHDESFYPIRGWIAYSKEPYKDDLMAGVRIYCRGKIAAQTSIFGRKAGFTGEHNVRSYLVGELHADWLDEDEDLIQTDRRDILWSDELGDAFQRWGQGAVLKIGKLSRGPTKKAALDLFLETGRVEERVQASYPTDGQKEIREQAIKVAKVLGRSISMEDARDSEVVGNLVDLSISLAPHVTLDGMMREAAGQTTTPLSALSSLLRTARIAELSSFGRIAEDRLKVINRLEALKDDDSTREDSLQNLIEEAPWLINPEWAPVTANKSLSRLKKEFEKYYERKTGEAISLSNFQDQRKRPDFVLSSQEGVIQMVEIKSPGHALQNKEMDRVIKYHDCMESFLEDESNRDFRRFFNGFHITLVCDNLALTEAQRAAYHGYLSGGKLTRINWSDFLLRTELVHQDFLSEAERQRTLISSGESC